MINIASQQEEPRKTVLFVAAALPPYPAPEADHALQEACHLADAGVDVHVLTMRREQVASPDNVAVHAIIDKWSWSELPVIWRLLGRIRPDATFIFFLGHLYNYSTMALFIPGMVKLRRPGTRVVSQFSNLGKGAPSGNRLDLRLRRWLFAKLGRFRYGTMLVASDALLVMSRPHVRRMEQIDPRLSARTVLVPPPPLFPVLPLEQGVAHRGRQRLGVAEDDFLFTYFGRLYPQKGVEMLLRSFARVRSELPRARLAMVGGYHSADAWWQRRDYPDEIDRLTTELALGDSVVWSGEYDWDSTDATEYLRATDVAVLPFDRGIHLHNSSFAAVMAHGLPAIVTEPARGFEPEIIHGVNVHAIPARDEQALVEALQTLYMNHILREELAAGAHALARDWFTWEGCVRTMLECLGLAPDPAATPQR